MAAACKARRFYGLDILHLVTEYGLAWGLYFGLFPVLLLLGNVSKVTWLTRNLIHIRIACRLAAPFFARLRTDDSYSIIKPALDIFFGSILKGMRWLSCLFEWSGYRC